MIYSLISEHSLVFLLCSECMCYQDADDKERVSCLQFFLTESVTTKMSESSARVVQMMANTISPILLDTMIKGKPKKKIQINMLIVKAYAILLTKEMVSCIFSQVINESRR